MTIRFEITKIETQGSPLYKAKAINENDEIILEWQVGANSDDEALKVAGEGYNSFVTESGPKELNYSYKRMSEYPSIIDQLDTLYHEGYDGWKAKIQAVKNKYPKGK
jgi:hypothetical protein